VVDAHGQLVVLVLGANGHMYIFHPRKGFRAVSDRDPSPLRGRIAATRLGARIAVAAIGRDAELHLGSSPATRCRHPQNRPSQAVRLCSESHPRS